MDIVNKIIPNHTNTNGVLITNDNFLTIYFKQVISGLIHNKIDIYTNLENVFIDKNTTYYVDNRVVIHPSSYVRFFEMNLLTGNRVCLLNFEVKRFSLDGINMKKNLKEILKSFEDLQTKDCKLINFSHPYHILTRQEIKVLNLISLGMSANSLAKSLNLSIKTIYAHRSSAVKKLGFKNFNSFVSSVFLQKNIY